jgi:rare lipoprotein A
VVVTADRRRLGPAGAATLAGLILLLAGCVAEAHPPESSFRADSRHPTAAAEPATHSGAELATLPRTDLPAGPPPPKPAVAETFTGFASWYGKKFHGRLTASGERYDMAALTAAHRTLPFGSRVKVTNLANGRFVVVTINDRGPYAKNRVIDLSHAAAKRLGIVDDGVAEVRLDILNDATDIAG